jgi:chemotaxis protein methyltransferase CheR
MSDEAAALEALKGRIRARLGFNADLYKDKCLRRRLEVRMRVRGSGSFAEYGSLLDRDPAEYERLMDTLTINVTKFFRNQDTWEAIRSDVVPDLLRPDLQTVRIWSAGCASGEEAFSMAILLRERAEAEDRLADLQRIEILGTDIDRASLAAARTGGYPELSFEETPPEVRSRWFERGGPPFHIRPELRQGVSFEMADVISDPPPREQSLILCRNVIIYFEREVQERLFQMFYDALLPGGFLVLGRVETLLGPARGRFRPVSPRQRVYRKPT